MPSYSRRRFLSHAGQVVAGSSLTAFYPQSSLFHTPAASDTVVVALIGCRSMGFFDLQNHLKQPGVVCGGLCDVDAEILEQRASEVEEMTGSRPRTYRDFRELLEEDDIDAVIIGTPDHWHCLQMVLACQAGKDVYVEKPMANSIAELDLMVRAAHHYNRVVQVGQQQRSGKHWQDVHTFVRSGKLGQIRRVKVWGYFDYGKGAPRVPDEAPPAHLDYDLWLGPAPNQPYNSSRLHSVWRHQWDFGGGLLTDWGVHLLDIVLWIMDIDTAPKAVSAVGGIYQYADRAIETPDTLNVIYELDDLTLTWEHTAGVQKGPYDRHYGIAFVGENGTLVVNRQGWEVLPEVENGAYRMPAMPPRSGQGSNHEDHAINFLEAMKNRTLPACTVEDGRNAAFFAHLGNIACRSGERLVWDESRRQFAGSTAANAYLKPAYRDPWTWPEF